MFKPEYENLNDPVTKQLTDRIVQAVSLDVAGFVLVFVFLKICKFHHHHHHHHHHQFLLARRKLNNYTFAIWRGDLKKPYFKRSPHNSNNKYKSSAAYVRHEQIRIISIKICALYIRLLKVGKLDEPVICVGREFHVLGPR